MSPNKNVMIVEDDIGIREALSEALSMLGYDPLIAENGQEGLNLLQKGATPRLILLDLMMPVMNGWEFITQYRSDSKAPLIPIVMMSADQSAEKRLASIPDIEFLKKPIDLDGLATVLEKYFV